MPHLTQGKLPLSHLSRTSILAAANPIRGRYDKTKTLQHNLNISAPIMSRFDLFYVVLDERDEYLDTNISKHILSLHRNKDEAVKPYFSQKEVLTYIKFCRSIKPTMTKEAADTLRQEYVKLRSNDSSAKKSSYRITVRQLESIIRLSEALAKVHADQDIRKEYVLEAVRLLSKSIITIKKEGVEMDEAQVGFDDIQKRRADEKKDDMEVDNAQEGETTQKKIQLSYDEYDKMGKQLIYVLKTKEAESDGMGIKQQDLVEGYLTAEEGNITTVEALEEMAKKLNSVIQRMITRENALIVIEDSKDKHERMLSLNINIDVDNFEGNK